MSETKILLSSGTLWKQVVEQTEYAKTTGALQSIETKSESLQQGEINFIVRTLANLQRKAAAKQSQAKTGKQTNPFLPYDRDLFVANISTTHLCLLNKYNVVDHHLLIVTSEFQPQENLLNLSDFTALAVCMQEIDGLAFYNAGKIAGASQPHKHLQLIPLSSSDSNTDYAIPIEPSIQRVDFVNNIGRIDSFQFKHAIAPLAFTQSNPTQAAESLFNTYQTLLAAVELDTVTDGVPAYNLLATREWMMLVARSQEKFVNISVNSLGFAGSLFVKDQQQMEQLKEIGPLNLLHQVAVNN